jgi:N-acetylmuramic acid 6-phosphate etherase
MISSIAESGTGILGVASCCAQKCLFCGLSLASAKYHPAQIVSESVSAFWIGGPSSLKNLRFLPSSLLTFRVSPVCTRFVVGRRAFVPPGYNGAMPTSFRVSKRKELRDTEQRNPASRKLDRMTALEIVRLMNREDRKVARAVEREIPAIARAVDAIVRGMRKGGRLIYVGAGSSGRMAVLDAAECPPTFGISPKQMQAVIAGGRRAVKAAVEGAEDAGRSGARDLRRKKLRSNDVVVGITASGTTPYVLGAMRYARERGATTVAIVSNRRMAAARLAKIVIAPEVGPEVLTGSTRLKAGTAQKMVLNMLSTAAMARLGHVYENLMIDVVATNEKLEERSLRMLAEASGKSVSEARQALQAAGHNMRVALVMLKRSVEAREARERLAKAKGDLRRALGE